MTQFHGFTLVMDCSGGTIAFNDRVVMFDLDRGRAKAIFDQLIAAEKAIRLHDRELSAKEQKMRAVEVSPLYARLCIELGLSGEATHDQIIHRVTDLVECVKKCRELARQFAIALGMPG